MGLDMYLDRVPKVEGLSLNELLEIEVTELKESKAHPYELIKDHIKDVGFGDFKWFSIREQVGYWRKANQIHNWFVKNVQDGVDECDPYEVSKKDLENLLSLCKEVVEDNSKASELLPSSSGFFFGSTDYDEWYFTDINDTIKIIEQVLETFDFEKNYLIYQSSW